MGRRSRRKEQPSRLAATLGGRWRLWIVGIVALAAVVILVTRLSSPQPHTGAELRAALIDQLSPASTNEEFHSSVKADIEHFGLPLDVYEGDEVDVDLYRALGEHPYGVLVIRSHSGTLELGGAESERTTALFTNEPYSERRHVPEQLADRVLIVRPFEDDSDIRFGVAPGFFRHNMRGAFPRTIVVVAGCSILNSTELAESLVSRGASVVISWDLSVGLEHADKATALLVHYLLAERMTVGEAVAATMDQAGPDPEYRAVLKYYPESAGRNTAEQLLEP